MSDTRESTVTVAAKSYVEFAEKVKELAYGNKTSGALAFLKSVGDTAVFTDAEGNRTYFVWERRRV